MIVLQGFTDVLQLDIRTDKLSKVGKKEMSM